MLRSAISRRLAALVLLFASPGLAGVAVAMAHPCPDQAPWTAETGSQSHQHHGDEPADQQQHDCQCVGDCLVAPAARALDPAPVLPVAVATEVFLPHSDPDVLATTRPAHRQPPATAPPQL